MKPHTENHTGLTPVAFIFIVFTIVRIFLGISHQYLVLHNRMRRCIKFIFRDTETFPATLKDAVTLSESGDAEKSWVGEDGWEGRRKRRDSPCFCQQAPYVITETGQWITSSRPHPEDLQSTTRLPGPSHTLHPLVPPSQSSTSPNAYSALLTPSHWAFSTTTANIIFFYSSCAPFRKHL